MKRREILIGAGMLAGGAALRAAELEGPPRPAVRPLPAPAPQPIPQDHKCGTCGGNTYGTSIEFVGSPSEAAARARKEEKLVFVLHVSGNFEDPGVT